MTRLDTTRAVSVLLATENQTLFTVGVNTVCLTPLELDPPQPVPEPVLHQSGPISGGAGKRFVLENRSDLRGKAGRTSLQEAPTQGGTLLPNPCGASLLQVKLNTLLF